jgi:hypothetical protein
MRQFTDAQHDALQRIADFDHIFAVLPGGDVLNVYAGLDLGLYLNAPSHAPDAYEPDKYATTLDGWQLPLSGLTGQYGYNGPWLHASEQIPGGVAEAVLSKPGYWVAIYDTYDCTWDTHPEYVDAPYSNCEANPDHCETTYSGWTFAYRPSATSTTTEMSHA